MTIPHFNERGVLERGIHTCTPQEFIDRFCIKHDYMAHFRGEPRSAYKQILEQLFVFFIRRGVKSIIFGGSFVTVEEHPQDIDCIVIFPSEKAIPADEQFIISNCQLDMVYCFESNREHIYKLLNMFATDRYELEVGLVEVLLFENNMISSWNDYEQYNDIESLILARIAYIDRHIITPADKKKMLITIHGINTNAEWNCSIAPIVSANKWIFGPYSYGDVKLPLVSNRSATKIITDFRSWVSKLYDTYKVKPCVLAHSFGSYILCRYIQDYEFNPPVKFENIVLAGAIINEEYNWNKVFENNVANLVVNIRCPNDQWVLHMDKLTFLKKDALYGSAAVNGFNIKHSRLLEEKVDIYDHGNMLTEDGFKNTILPLFSLSETMSKVENIEYDIIKYSKLLTEKYK